MKIIRVLVALFVLAFAVSAYAQDVTLTTKAKEMYLGVNGARFYDEAPVSQSDVFVLWKNGYYADVWGSSAANSELKFDKEIDFTFGRGGQIGEHAKYLAEGVYFAVQGIDILDFNVEVSGTTNAIAPFVRLEAYAPRKTGGLRKGTMTSLGVRGNLKYGKWNFPYEEYARRDSGCFGFDKGILAQGRVGVGYDINVKTSVGAGIRFSEPLTDFTDGRHNEVVWDIGLVRTF